MNPHTGRSADDTTGTTGASVAQLLTFSLGGEVFAMDIHNVREIIQHGPMTVVPLMPAFVRGVINLRGAVVPVIDLQSRFGRAPACVGPKTCIVIFDAMRSQERVELGLLVDSVSEVLELPADQLEPSPDFGASVRRDFIRAMGKVDGRFVIVIDPDRVLDIDEMARLCEPACGAVA